MTIIRNISLAAGLLGCVANLLAQRQCDVQGSAEYWLPRNVSRAVGEQQVLDMAKIDALAKEFGTIVHSDTQLDTHVNDRGETNDYWSTASTTVKGEWVETKGKPEFGIRLDNDDIVLTCTVQGRAREIKGPRAQLDVRVLRNGTTDNCETNTFVDGEKCYVAFTSPVKGYVAMYLEDDEKNMIRLLPFPAERGVARAVNSDERYVFFVRDDGVNEQYAMTTSKPSERNAIHVVFSPNAFVRPVEQSAEFDDQMRQLDSGKFRKWLTQARAADPEMQEVVRSFTITSAMPD